MHQQISNLFKLASRRNIQNVIAAIVQIVARATDRAEGSVTCGHPGKGNGFFGFEGSGGSGGFSHFFFLRGARQNAHRISRFIGGAHIGARPASLI